MAFAVLLPKRLLCFMFVLKLELIMAGVGGNVKPYLLSCSADIVLDCVIFNMIILGEAYIGESVCNY